MSKRIAVLVAMCAALVGTVTPAFAGRALFTFSWQSSELDAEDVLKNYISKATLSCADECGHWAEMSGSMVVDTDLFLFKAPDGTKYDLKSGGAVIDLIVHVTDYQLDFDLKQKKLNQLQYFGMDAFKELAFSTGDDFLDFTKDLCGQEMLPDPSESHSFCSRVGHVGSFYLVANDLNEQEAPTYSWAYEMDTFGGTNVILTSMRLIPEPSSILLAACGMVGLLSFRRRIC